MTFGLTIEKLLLIGLIAVVIIGPERLPAAAESLRRTIQQVRRLARTTQERVRDELGPDVADIDWQRLDPRQYDPRRIIREALLAEPETPSSATGAAATAAQPDHPALTDRESPPPPVPPLVAPASPELGPASRRDDTESAGEAVRARAGAAASAPGIVGTAAEPGPAIAPDDIEPAVSLGDAEPASAPEDAESPFAPDDGEPAWEAVPVRARSTASVDLRAPLPAVGDGSSR